MILVTYPVDLGQDFHDTYKICSTGMVENEFHVLISCPFYKHLRQKCYTNIDTICKNFRYLDDRMSHEKFIYLMTCESDVVKHVAEFCYDIFFWRGEFEEISNALVCRDDKPEVTTRCGRKVNPPMRLIEIDK